MIESYLRFERDHRSEIGKKTQVWLVFSAAHGFLLGEVRWNGPWRQYVLWPEGNTIWSQGCLDEITRFIRRLMADRKPS